MIWIIVDLAFFMLLLLRKKVRNEKETMPQRSISKVRSFGERVLDVFFNISWLFPIGVIIYIVMLFIPDMWIQKIMDWYKGIFIVALFPIFLTWIKEQNFKIKSIWNVSLFALTVFFSIVGYTIDTGKIEEISQYRVLLNMLMTIFIVVFFAALLEMRKERNEYYSKKISKRGIRKDLYHRTPGLEVNVLDIDLIKSCEKYFSEYMDRYGKIKGLCTIEYVKLTGVYSKLWYKKAACFMKIFMVLSTLVVIIKMGFGMENMLLVLVGLMIGFGVMVGICKHIDEKHLYKIGIRYVYDEWGYYMTCRSRNKFVGRVQLIEVSKYHKYVHSFLDIAALCRAIAFNDKMHEERKICIITRSFGELFADYTDYNQKKDWVMVIPLWISALFEFFVTGKVEDKTKVILLDSADKRVSTNIFIFLQSFWADMERKYLQDGISEYVQLFKEELFDCSTETHFSHQE